MRTITLIAFAGAGLLAACADSGPNYTPVLDGAPSLGFQSDLSACQSLAQNQFGKKTLRSAAIGAGAGAALGEAENGDATGGAIAGALAGGVANKVKVSEKRKAVVVECMQGRGHAVVG